MCALDEETPFLELQNQGKNRGGRTPVKRPLREKNQSDFRVAGLRLELAELVLLEPRRAEIAADQAQ